jgi:hypothetical protein
VTATALQWATPTLIIISPTGHVLMKWPYGHPARQSQGGGGGGASAKELFSTIPTFSQKDGNRNPGREARRASLPLSHLTAINKRHTANCIYLSNTFWEPSKAQHRKKLPGAQHQPAPCSFSFCLLPASYHTRLPSFVGVC